MKGQLSHIFVLLLAFAATRQCSDAAAIIPNRRNPNIQADSSAVQYMRQLYRDMADEGGLPLSEGSPAVWCFTELGKSLYILLCVLQLYRCLQIACNKTKLANSIDKRFISKQVIFYSTQSVTSFCKLLQLLESFLTY